MDRLTYWSNRTKGAALPVQIDELGNTVDVETLCAKLAEYEDTMLTPQEIVDGIRFVIRENAELYKYINDFTGAWISVKDRLPQSGTHVLMSCRMDSDRDARYVCDGYFAAANTLPADIAYLDEIETTYSDADDTYYLASGWYEVVKNWGEWNSISVNDTNTLARTARTRERRIA